MMWQLLNVGCCLGIFYWILQIVLKIVELFKHK